MYKFGLYLDAFVRTLKEIEVDKEEDTDVIKRAVFYGIKALNSTNEEGYMTEEEILNELHLITGINTLIGALTPNEFMNVFPISKEYDGDKWGVKDYFYTRKYIDSLDRNKPIGTERDAFNFLWEYHNYDTKEFLVRTLMRLSDFKKLQGEPSLAEEFAEENDIKMYKMYKDDKGNKFMLDPETGKTTKVRKPIPRHLKVVK